MLVHKASASLILLRWGDQVATKGKDVGKFSRLVFRVLNPECRQAVISFHAAASV